MGKEQKQIKMLNKIQVFCVVSALSLVITTSLFTNNLYAWSFGPPAYRTGAPVDGGTCNAKGCHKSFATNSGTAQFLIDGPTVYTPGKSVSLTVSFINFTEKVHGFEMTAVDASGKRVGTFKKFIKTDKTTQVIPPNSKDGLKRGLKTVDKDKYIEQTFKGIKNTSWKVKWIAPASATNPITFYAAGVDGNDNGGAKGDYVYTATKEITTK